MCEHLGRDWSDMCVPRGPRGSSFGTGGDMPCGVQQEGINHGKWPPFIARTEMLSMHASAAHDPTPLNLGSPSCQA